jgi:hypothetical protein
MSLWWGNSRSLGEGRLCRTVYLLPHVCRSLGRLFLLVVEENTIVGFS